MQILIVMMQEVRMSSYHLPMGVGYISASLKRAGHEVRVLNPNHSTQDLEPQLIQAISTYKPQVVAIGGMSFHMRRIRQSVVTVRPLLPNSVIIVGGVAVSNHPQLTMRALPEADIGVVGEGEQTIVELVNALAAGDDLATVNGIIYWQVGRKLLQTPPRLLEKNLDSLPWIDWEGVGLDTYAGLHGPGDMAPGLIMEPGARVMPFLTSRGCPFSCTFCCHELLGRRYRTRALDDVFAELEFAIDRFGINTVAILDDVFALKPSKLQEFCQRVRGYDLRWECSLRVEQVTADNVKLMRDSGCVCISFGVESMSPTVLESMQKSTTREDLCRALDLIYEAKITPWANLIFGDPAETMATAKESLEWWAENNRFNLRTAFIGYHPGSRIYEDAVKNGVIKDPQAFIMSESAEINGTSISDLDYAKLQNIIVPQYVLSFGLPGKILHLADHNGEYLTMRSICPHCAKEQYFTHLRLKANRINTVSCMHCNQLQNIPIKFRNSSTPAYKKLFAKLQGILQANADNIPTAMMPELFTLCQEINNIDSGDELPWRIMLQILELQNREQEAIEQLKIAIANNPYSPHLFEQMANRLAKMHQDEERVKYARQAALLRSLGINAAFNIELA